MTGSRTRNPRTGLSIRTLAAFLLPAAALVYLFIWLQTGELFSAQVEIRKAALDLERLTVDELEVRVRDEAEAAAQRPPGPQGFPFAFRMDETGVLEIIEPAPPVSKKVWPLPGSEQENLRFNAFLDELEQREFIRNDVTGAEEVVRRLEEDEAFRVPGFWARSALARGAFLKRRGKFDEIVPELIEVMSTVDPAAASGQEEFPFVLKALLLFIDAPLSQDVSIEPVRRRAIQAMADGLLPLSATELRATAESLSFLDGEQAAALLRRAGAMDATHALMNNGEAARALRDNGQATRTLMNNGEAAAGMAKLSCFAVVSLGRLWMGRTEGGLVRGSALDAEEGLDRLLVSAGSPAAEGGLALRLEQEGAATKGEVIRALAAPAAIEGAVLRVLLVDRSFFEQSVKSRRTFILGAALFLVVAMAVLGIATFRAVRREVAAAKARSDFMAGVSHELRTPLASIRMFAELLEEGRIKEPDTRLRFMRLISSNCRRLSAMIENVLDLSRSEKGLTRFRLEEVDLGRLLEDLFRDIRAFAEEEGFLVDVEIAHDLPAVRADPMALARAVFNLCDNARKYSGEDKRILVKAVKLGGDAVISIRDFGSGIAASERERVFQRFQRGGEGEGAAAGVGLGLSLAREAVEGCGGKLDLESETGEGSTFLIHLPGMEDVHDESEEQDSGH